MTHTNVAIVNIFHTNSPRILSATILGCLDWRDVTVWRVRSVRTGLSEHSKAWMSADRVLIDTTYILFQPMKPLLYGSYKWEDLIKFEWDVAPYKYRNRTPYTTRVHAIPYKNECKHAVSDIDRIMLDMWASRCAADAAVDSQQAELCNVHTVTV